MIWAGMVGLVIGSAGAPPLAALATVAALVGLKGLAEIAFAKSPITGSESPYALYVENLRATGSVPSVPWAGYLLQMMLFGTAIGMVVYGLFHFLV